MTAPSARPVAVVTGGAKRLGRHLALFLARRGFDVVIFYRASAQDAQVTVKELEALGARARALAVDISVEVQVAHAFAEIQAREARVDLLINNVGNYNPQPIEKLTPATWDATLSTNLSGAFYCSFHALKFMKDGGHIINIGTAGLEGLRANVRGADYYVSKTGILSLTRSLAKAYAVRGIRVNMVSPGQLENSVDLPPPSEMGRTVPLARAGRLDEIADTVGYLLDAAYVTGVNIDVAGGYRL